MQQIRGWPVRSSRCVDKCISPKEKTTLKKIEKSAEDQKNQKNTKNQFSETPREIKKSAEDQKNQKKPIFQESWEGGGQESQESQKIGFFGFFDPLQTSLFP